MAKESKGKGVSNRGEKVPSKAEVPAPPDTVGIKSKGGRPSTFSYEVVEQICERLSKGEPLAAICREEGMPGARTVYDWMEAREDVSAAIARARDEGEDQIALDCLNIADDNGRDIRYLADGREITDADVVQRAKLRIDTRLKLLAKWNPKRWGERLELDAHVKATTTEVIRPHVPHE